MKINNLRFTLDQFKGIKVKVDVHHKVCILFDDSGTGKTFLMKVISHYCKLNNIKCRYINYENSQDTPDDIISYCRNTDVVLLDNADLYFNGDILRELKSTCGIIIISIKNACDVDKSDAAFYRVIYKNQMMIVGERNDKNDI